MLSAICLLGIIILLGIWHYGRLWRLGIRYPIPLPLLGHWHLILQNGYRADSWLKEKYGKIFGQYEGLRPTVVLCDPELIQECTIKRFSDFPQRIVPFPVSEEVKNAVTTAEGAEWKRQRNIMTRAFSANKMRKLAILINDCARQFTDNLGENCKNKDVECRKICGDFVMRVVATSLFGVDVRKDEELEKFSRYGARMGASLDLRNPVMFLSLLSRRIFPPIFKTFFNFGYKRRGPVKIDCFKFFQSLMIQMKKHREQLESNRKPNDLLQLLLDAHKSDITIPKCEIKASNFDETETSLSVTSDISSNHVKRGFSTEDIVSNAIIFFSAGYITTTGALSWAMYLLAVHPDIQERLLQELIEIWPDTQEDISFDTIASLTYLDQVFCETLRLFPSTQRLDRIAIRDSELGGIRIPKGLQVNISVWAVQHDETYWPQPYTFDPERFSPENKGNIVPGSYIPFGSGPRNCIGMRLATLEWKICISHLVRRFRLFPCSKTEIPPNLRNQVHTAPKGGIHLRLEQR